MRLTCLSRFTRSNPDRVSLVSQNAFAAPSVAALALSTHAHVDRPRRAHASQRSGRPWSSAPARTGLHFVGRVANSSVGHEVDGSRRRSRALTIEKELRVPLKVVVSTISKDLSRDFLIRRCVRVWSATNAGRDVSLLRLSHAKAGDELVRHLDPGEAGGLEPSDQLTLVPPYERSPPVLLAGLVIVLDFTPLRLKPVIESAGAHPIPYLLRDLVDGLEDGHPAPGLQHPV